MRQRFGISILLIAIASGAMAMSPPQYTLQRTLKGSIGASPLVSVGDVRAEGDAYVVDVASPDLNVAHGLAFALNKEYNFAGIRLTIRVLDGQGNPIETPDTPVTGNLREDAQHYFEDALAGNPLFVGFVDFLGLGIETGPTIVQFWNDNIGDPNGFSNLIAADAFHTVCRADVFGNELSISWITASMQEIFASEGFLPAVAHSAGRFGSLWTTGVWIASNGASSVELWFYPVNSDNSHAVPVTVALTAAVTPLNDVVATLFKTNGTGALRYRADGPVRVIGRTWSPAQGGTSGHIARGVTLRNVNQDGFENPSFMIVDQRPGFRANLGLINAHAMPMTVQVDVLTADWVEAPGFATLTVELPPFGVTQIGDVLGRMAPGRQSGLIVRARVVSAQGGALIAYLCDVDNATNSPTYQEAFFG